MKELILVIDDQQDFIDLLKMLLGAHLPETEVVGALNGPQGLEIAQARKPQLVLLDVKMPGMDGYEVCRLLKDDPGTAEIPVLMVSGIVTGTKHRVRGLDTGAEGYVCKPFEPPEFLAQVRSLLRLKRGCDDLHRREQNLEATLQERTGALQASEEKFRLLFDRSPDGIFVEGEDGTVLDANPAACRLHGCTRGELVGRSVFDLVPVEERAAVRCNFPKRFSGELTELEGYSLTSAGRRIPVEVRSSLITYQDRQALLLHVRDITERREAEEQLWRAEEKYRTLVEQLPAITYVIELGDPPRHVYISPQVQTLLGVTPVEWMADPQMWSARLHPEDRERVVNEVTRQNRAKKPFVFEYRAVATDGHAVWFRNQGVYLRDAASGRWSVHGVMVDVTAQKEAERALRASEEQLQQARKMEALGRLSGGIAHDFNNLLTTILGFGRMVSDDPALPEGLREEMADIIRAGERAAELVHQLLAFSHKQMVEMIPLDLNEVVGDMDRLLRRTLGEDVELVTLLNEVPCMIEADAGQIGQVVMNLAVNARHAMPQGGKLTIRTATVRLGAEYCRRHGGAAPGGYALLDIADTGCGMTPEVRDRAFEPFFTTREKGKGTGLGLTTVYGIVTQANGFIDLESAPGEGSRFQIYFPPLTACAARPKSQPLAELPGGCETILLVEDESAVRRLAKRMLGSLGYRVLEAANGVEALQVFEANRDEIALVLSDMVMPQLGGLELAGRLQRLRPEVRVLLMTGFTQEDFIEGGPDGRRTPVLLKPFTREQLALKVRETLDG